MFILCGVKFISLPNLEPAPFVSYTVEVLCQHGQDIKG
jgi:hypothetical protein